MCCVSLHYQQLQISHDHLWQSSITFHHSGTLITRIISYFIQSSQHGKHLDPSWTPLLFCAVTIVCVEDCSGKLRLIQLVQDTVEWTVLCLQTMNSSSTDPALQDTVEWTVSRLQIMNSPSINPQAD